MSNCQSCGTALGGSDICGNCGIMQEPSFSMGNCANCGTDLGTGNTCGACGLAANALPPAIPVVGGTPCQGCGDPLGPNDIDCANCGLPVNLNAAMSGNNPNAQQLLTGGGGVLAGGLGSMLVNMGGGGWHGGPVSEDTEKKIEDALGKMPSLQDRNAEFLKSIGADPAKATLGPKQARKKIAELMQARQQEFFEIYFLGNSLGIDEIRVVDSLRCPTCSNNDLYDEDYDDASAPNPGEKWCPNEETWIVPVSSDRTFSRKEADWVEWKRIWEALSKDYGPQFKVGGGYGEYDEKMREYLPLVETTETAPPPDLMDLIEGMDVRLEDPQGESYYARVWQKNPLDPIKVPEFLNLKTMQPMTVTREWRVVEVV